MEDKRKQVIAQFKAVAHMAQVLSDVHKDLAAIHEAAEIPDLDLIGEMTAARMETLGDMLNNMDAVSEDDAWLSPIFAEAQRRWPTKTPRSP